VRHSALLATTSLFSILLFTIHVADDIVRGLDKPGYQNGIGIVVIALWTYAAIYLIERRSGLIVALLGGILCAGMPLVHFAGKYVTRPEFMQSPGALFFIWVLWALSILGTLSVILAVRGLWLFRRPQPA
jgi:hypothetical protein